ncbi:HEAT repeat domain-containing protein [Candidatus Peregrinibacteria bacterium]|nr:HEAT repeat domain-containing protein [Candidatus Peregrinibacteria bacterium]
MPFLNRIFNIGDHEWPRVIVVWSMRFLFFMGSVMGWTVLVSMFLIRLGFSSLPYLFIANAFLIMAGTFLYSKLVSRVSKEVLMAFTALGAGATLYFATFFPAYSNFLFFGFILVANAILLGQLNILISCFIEELFSPLESERAFPIIESAETFGGIIGGALVGFLAPYIPAYKFLFLWVIAILLIVPLILGFRTYAKKVPFLEFKKRKHLPESRVSQIMKGYKIVHRVPFLQGLLGVVILSWIFINLLEFQYIGAIAQSITTKANYEQTLTQTLGFLHIIFSASALFVQLIFASRFIKTLGIIRAMLLQPIVMFGTLIGLTFRFNFFSAVLSKTSFEITHIVSQNDYQSSYYSVPHDIRESAKEFLEGIAKPFGAILGMIALLNFQNFFEGNILSFIINLSMLAVIAGIFFILSNLKEKYAETASYPLGHSGEHFEKFHAIEILSQKGHADSAHIIAKNLSDPKENIQIKIKILSALGELKDPETIPDILDILSAPQESLRAGALSALVHFPNLGSHVFSQAFSKYRVIETLKALFLQENSEDIRTLIIAVLAGLNQSEIAGFILETLKKSKSLKIQGECIKACGLFHDPNAGYYLEKYIDFPEPDISASTITALWQFPKYRKRLAATLNRLLESRKISDRISGVQALGEMGDPFFIPSLQKYLADTSSEIRRHAIISLAQLGSVDVLESFSELLLDRNSAVERSMEKALETLPLPLKYRVHQIIQREAGETIAEILNSAKKSSLEELNRPTLVKLKKLYTKAREIQEVLKIEEILGNLAHLHPETA